MCCMFLISHVEAVRPWIWNDSTLFNFYHPRPDRLHLELDYGWIYTFFSMNLHLTYHLAYPDFEHSYWVIIAVVWKKWQMPCFGTQTLNTRAISSFFLVVTFWILCTSLNNFVCPFFVKYSGELENVAFRSPS